MNLPLYGFPDRLEYIYQHAANANEFLKISFSNGVLGFLFGQPLWFVINKGLTLFFNPEVTFKFILFFSASLGVYSSLRIIDKENLKFIYKIIYIFYFFSLSLLFDRYITHIRQGLAISLFLFSFTVRGKISNIIKISTPFIHYSFYPIIFLFFLAQIITKRGKKARIRTIIFLLSCIVIFFSLFSKIALFINIPILSSYSSNMFGSGNAFYFFSLILLIFLLVQVQVINNNIFVIFGLVLYLSAYYTFGNPLRLFENILPIVIIKGFSLPIYNRYTLIFLLFFLSFFLYL